MPVTVLSISQEEALCLLKAILEKASGDGGDPVAIAIVNASARLVAFVAMDGVAPASITLSQSKAYSSVIGQKDTSYWASMPDHVKHFDMRNWTDEQFTGFTGGVVIESEGHIIGGIGISGRRGKMSEQDLIMQDSELAKYGKGLLFQIQ